MKRTPIFAGMLAFLFGGIASAQTPIKVLNSGFADGANPAATGWTSVDGAGTNGAPSNYAENVPNLSSRTMQIKSDGGNYIQQALALTAADLPVSASSFGTWSVSFLKGYRRDAVRNGDHTLRVSLWNTTNDAELAGADVVIADPGSTGTNSLSPSTLVLSYDETAAAVAGAGIALRVTSTSADLAGTSWQRTAIVDDFSVVAGVVDPRLEVDPVPVFANNGTSATFTLGFSNQGSSQNLAVSGVTLDGLDASLFTVNSFTASTAPGASGQIQLGFTPPSSGTFTANVVIASNASGSPSVSVPVTVNVVDPVLTLGSAVVDFGSLPANPGSQTLNLALTNSGGASNLDILDAQFVGMGGNGFSIVSSPLSIAPGASGNVVISFAPGSDGGDFGDLLRIETTAAVAPIRYIPVKAKVASTTAPKPVQLVNAGFENGVWNSSGGTAPQGWVSSLAATSIGGNYGQAGDQTPNITGIAAHMQSAGGYYEQNLSANNGGLSAASAGTITVSLDAAYRNDAITAGPILLRLGLWDATNGVEIVGRDLVLPDNGVQSGTASNQLAPFSFRMSYNAAGYGTEQLALRITQLEPRLAVNPWQATAIMDNFTVSVDGSWVPVNAFADWALASGLDGSTGKENGRADDPDRDGRSNFDEFAFGGNPLSGTLSSLQALSIVDANANSQRELVLTVAVRSGASFSGSPSPAASADGVNYLVQGSTDLASFLAPVEGPFDLPAVPAGLPASPPAGYKYVSFRLTGSEGLAGKGFLRATGASAS